MNTFIKICNLRNFYFEKIKAIGNRGEFGVGSLLSIAIALIIAAFVLVPGMRDFSQSVIDGINGWWTNTISSQVFPTT